MLALSNAMLIVDFFGPRFLPLCEPGCCKVAGSVRREKSFVHDIEFVMKPLDTRPPLQFGVKPKDQPKTLLDAKLNELVAQEWLFFQQGADRNKKYYVNMEKFNLIEDPNEKGFKLDLWITIAPAQFGVNYVIRTGPGSPQDNFSKWIVTPRAQGGKLPDAYRVKHCAVWRVEQLDEKDQPFEGECPLAMPTEEDFLDFLGVTAAPGDRHADWGRYTR